MPSSSSLDTWVFCELRPKVGGGCLFTSRRLKLIPKQKFLPLALLTQQAG